MTKIFIPNNKITLVEFPKCANIYINKGEIMILNEIREKYELVDLFCNLAEIPSPSLKEKKVSDWIMEYCKHHKIPCKYDNYENIYINIPATDSTKQPILLSSHMDVIGDDSPVKTYLDGDFIRAEGRTLGADDKAGVANALYLAKWLVENNLKHGGLEIIFTRDEESGMSGIKHVDFSTIKSKYVLVCDSDSLGQLMTSGASYTLATIEVNSFKGGHSGIDIADRTRENAAKLIADIVANLPQGVYYSEDCKVVTSCNIGGIISGNPDVTNVINTYGKATYSIRSSSRKYEQELKDRMQFEVDEFNKEYDSIAKAELTFEEHLPPFEKVEDEYIPILFETAARKVGVTPEISSFHAGAETHIYANNKNADGQPFAPYLAGLATVCNMHSKEEYLDYKTLLKGQELLQEFFRSYNK